MGCARRYQESGRIFKRFFGRIDEAEFFDRMNAMKIYTRRGDDGSTGLYGSGRLTKSSMRIESIGEVDELNSLLGCVLAAPLAPSLQSCLAAIQDDLFHVGAELASPDPIAAKTAKLDSTDVERLEAWIDHYDAELEPLRHFILPGGSPVGAQLFLARAVARRVERSLVRASLWGVSGGDGGSQGGDGLHSGDGLVKPRDLLVAYLNRLADLLFVMARWQNRHDRESERAWFAETRDQVSAESRLPGRRSNS